MVWEWSEWDGVFWPPDLREAHEGLAPSEMAQYVTQLEDQLEDAGRWKAALEQILDRHTIPWPEYATKYGLPMDGRTYQSAGDIACQALKAPETEVGT